MPRSPKPAKITEPRPAQVLLRRALFRRLDVARRRGVVWVTAPPGAGKTTLVASYLRARRLQRWWYRVDARDADPATLFHYLHLAARRAPGARRRSLPPPLPALPADPIGFAPRFFEALFAAMPAPCALVLDDYQEASGDAPLHDLVRVAGSVLPRGRTVIVVSRAAPPPVLAGLIGADQLSILDWEDLKLSPQESAALARLRGAHRDLDRLHALTGGWAAGLVLLLEAGRREIRPLSIEDDVGAQRVFDYFAAELFDRCAPEVRDLLVRTALPPSFTAAMAERLTGSPQARARVAELGRDRFFLERGDGPQGAWRYHPLFRAFLLDRAQAVLAPEALRAARLAAGELLAEEGQLEDAFELLARAGDTNACAALVRRHAPELLAQGRGGVLERWTASLSGEAVAADGWLSYWSGVCRLGALPGEARQRLQHAAARFEADGDRLGLLLASVDLARAALHEGDDFRRLDRWIATAEALLAAGVALPSPALALHVATAMTVAMFARQPAQLETWAARQLQQLEHGASIEQCAASAGALVMHQSLLGHVGEASRALERLRPARGAAIRDPFAEVTVHLGEAAYAWVRGDNAAAVRQVEAGLAVAGANGVLAWRLELAALGAAASLASGDAERAHALLGQLTAGVPYGGRFARGNHEFYGGWEAFLRGDIVGACALARAAIVHADECDFPFARALGRIAGALALREHGRADEARALLAEAAPLADDHSSAVVRYTFLLAAADSALRDGDEARGLALLDEGLRLGRERDLANMFWLTPALAARLTERALAAGLEVPYVQRLVRSWRVRPAAPPVHLEHWPWAIEVRVLGGFELRRDGVPLVFRGKAQEMPLRLLAALVALGEGEASAAALVEVLWPDADGDAGRRVLDTTLHRLRRLLGTNEAVAMSEGQIRLDRRLVWLDVAALGTLLQRIERTRDPELADSLLALYRGPLLPAHDHAWILPARARLHDRTVAALLQIGHRLEQQRADEAAADLYARCLAVDDLAEPLYCALMRCHHRLGRESEALRIYDRCARVLRSRLGIGPSSETVRLRDQITRSVRDL